MGLNILVIWFGPIGHTCGPSLFLSVATFLLVIASVDRVSGPQPFLAGLWAGTASASLLLMAPVAPIRLLWSLRHPGSGERLKKGACFLAGTGRPLLPLLWPMAHGTSAGGVRRCQGWSGGDVARGTRLVLPRDHSSTSGPTSSGTPVRRDGGSFP
jgi:hypothetical protein